MKNRIKKIILFILLLLIVITTSFEITFRFFSADSVLHLLDKLSFLGFGQSIGSLVVFLLLLSFLFSMLIFFVGGFLFKKRNGK